MFDISQDQRAQYVYTVISLLFLSANLIYIIVLAQFIFESKVFLIIKMSLLWHSFVNCCSISGLVFVVWETLLKMINIKRSTGDYINDYINGISIRDTMYIDTYN